MALNFEPKTEEQLNNLMPDGQYNFHVSKAEDYVAKTSGDEMIKLTLLVWDHNGRERQITDYLTSKAIYKIKHFCDAVGLTEKYSSGNLHASDCEGSDKIGKLLINTQKGQGEYGPRNSVKDYVKREASAQQEPFHDDEIAF